MEQIRVREEQSRLDRKLNEGLFSADNYINRNYLINAINHTVLEPDKDPNWANRIRLFEVNKIVYDKKENVNDKLISVYASLQNIQGSVLLIVDGKPEGVKLYIGVKENPNTVTNIRTSAEVLYSSFMGNFPGSELTLKRTTDAASIMESVVTSGIDFQERTVSSVTVIPSMRDKEKDKFVQGMEKFIDTMRSVNRPYTAILIASAVSKMDLEMRKRGLEDLCSSLSPLAKTTLAYGENSSEAVTEGTSETFSKSINENISNTNGTNSGTNSSESRGTSSGDNFGGGGFGFNTGRNQSRSQGYSSGRSWSKSVSKGTSESTSTGTNASTSKTDGSSLNMTVEHQNKSVMAMMEKIDAQLKRIRSCETFGLWEFSGYFLADDVATSVVAANTYKALMSGEESDIENSFINTWTGNRESEKCRLMLDFLKRGNHPLLLVERTAFYQEQIVTPSTMVSGKELPILMGIPQKSVSGVSVSSIAEFGRNVVVQRRKEGARTIELGCVHHMGVDERAVKVNLDLDSFTSHCFVTGSTGSGKSNTTYGLLGQFLKNGVPFLVVEPAKGEYKEAFGAVEGINIFSTNPAVGQMLKLNPFRFDRNIHVLEHLDRLIEIFNACWEMYAAMPAILKDAVEQIYVEKGWDLLNSVYMGEGDPVYPTFRDLMKALPNVINNSGYSSNTKGDYTGALVTRVTSLTNGISGQIFCDSYDIPDRKMFDENTIVDLSRVGSTETKSLIMGILVLKLSEYRMANAKQANSGLRHITVLEEAHNLLKRTTPGQGSNVVGKSVEMICNSIAEMRTYGEGFIIVDQSPTAVDIAAIKNTNTKILMRLPEKGDCEAVGNAAGLNEDQIKEMAKLGTGIAVVMQNNWLEAVLTHINAFDNTYEKKICAAPYASIKRLRGAVAQELMLQYIERKTMDMPAMMRVIAQTDMQLDSVDYSDPLAYKREEMRCCMRYTVARLAKMRDMEFFCDTLMNLSGAKNLFDIVEAPKKVAATETEREHYDRNSVRQWKDTVKKELTNYLTFAEGSEKFYFAIIKYLLHAKEAEQSHIDCVEISRMLF